MDSSFLNQAYQDPAENILADVCEQAATMDDVIDLSVGDPNFATPLPIVEAALQGAKQGHTHYTAAMGMPELRSAVSEDYNQRYDLTYTPQQAMITVGAEHALFIALKAVINPGDEIIVPEPCFSPYIEQVEMCGGKPVVVSTKPEDGFAILASAVAEKITPKTKGIIINSPNNPTGMVMTAKQLQDLGELAIKHDLLIFSDEVYYDFVLPGQEFVPMAKFAPENTVTINGFSKSFAMTGWRIGYLMAPQWLTDAAGMVNDGITFSAPTISQDAALYAIQHHDELAKPITTAFAKRLDYLEAALNQLDWLKVSPIGGGIYAFVDIQQTGLDSVAFADQLLKATGILVVPGLAFGQAGEGFERIAATQSLDVLQTAVARLKQLKWGK